MEALLKSPLASVPGYTGINVQEVISIGAWYIWWLRRRQTHGEQVPPVRSCVNSIRAIAANAARSNRPTTALKMTSWLEPRAGFLKLNVDAAFSASDHMGAAGMILRDGQGGFVAAKTRHLPQVSSVAMAEALAMSHGLSFARSLGYHAIEAESDSLEVIQLCSGEERIWNEATAVYADILEQASQIGKVEFTHCGRDLNSVAHELARFFFFLEILVFGSMNPLDLS
jgi:ribonuclease HI